MKNLRKNVLLVGILAVLITSNLKEYEYMPQYEILGEDNDAFASYRNGLIYIGDEDFLCSVSTKDGDVQILDKRFGEDPNFKIYHSYEICDQDARDDILEVLSCYEECYPSDWNRSLESMRLEWALHNLSYDIHYQRESCTDVDLNNNDEEKYNHPILQKILHL